MTYPVKDTVVWAEIPVTNLDEGIAFYQSLFNTEMPRTKMEPNDVAFFPKDGAMDVAGHLYEGTPAPKGSGPTIHLHAPDSLEATIERIRKSGAEILGEPIPLPDGRFQYAVDPFGNSIGIFQKSS
ncbi:VOC family protein [Cognatishimia sp. SS12]|uniref:VOC family protein n=1 Tax=Cognatishimia sp. SS12 TaxID=2979465 RepID=UPI00232EE578|nr:VOC family protein [Cognatishimia sp. SS12]MDC0737615.1 VOC family protein [Cognatishimia sp. SS12]